MVRNDVVEVLKQMISVCAWCGGILGRRWTTNGGVSHGICNECRAKLMKDREGGKADVQLSAQSGIDCNVLIAKKCSIGTGIVHGGRGSPSCVGSRSCDYS